MSADNTLWYQTDFYADLLSPNFRHLWYSQEKSHINAFKKSQDWFPHIVPFQASIA